MKVLPRVGKTRCVPSVACGICGLLLVVGYGRYQQTPPPAIPVANLRPYPRNRISTSSWRFQPDPDDTGLSQRLVHP